MRVQRLAVDGGLLAVAALQDGLFTIEHVADVTGRTSHMVMFGDFETVVFWVSWVVTHPSWSGMDTVTGFQGSEP